MNKADVTTADALPTRGRRLFTVETANQALVFVERVVRDIVTSYRELMTLRERRAELSLGEPPSQALEDATSRIETVVEYLADLERELVAVGCDLKDWETGLIDFPALLDGRRVCLCWRLGESEITHWHEWEAGFAGRQPIDETVRRQLKE